MHNPTPQLSPEEQLGVALRFANKNFHSFLRFAFKMLEPNTTFQPNWHIDFLCYQLQRSTPTTSPLNPAPSQPQLRNLVINVPPRSLKTIIASVAFPAWLLGHQPHTKFIIASYSTKASANIAAQLARLLKHPLYHQIFPTNAPRLQKATEAFITTEQGGQILATSPQGTVTSFGADYLIIDDLLSPEQAFSKSELHAANRFFFNTLYPSRLNDKTKGVTLVIAQRLHESDLPGQLIARNEDAQLAPSERFHLTKLPAVFYAEEPPTHQTYHFYNQQYCPADHLTTAPSHPNHPPHTLLTPKRDTLASLLAIRTDPNKGPYTFASQYQQEPAPPEGNIINITQFQHYTARPDPTQVIRIIQSWDTAIKTTATSDFSVCTTWAQTKSHHFLLDVFIAKLEFPALKLAAIQQAALHSPHLILIEDKASGQQLIQTLRKETTLPIKAVMPAPRTDKITRIATAIPAALESQSLLIPADAALTSWYPHFEKQIINFPHAAHDDIPDSIAQYLIHTRDSVHNQFRIRTL